jgi:serine/threonine-protein kinase
MDAVPLDSGPMAAAKRTYTVERPRFPLVWKLFGLTALLIAGVVGLAALITLAVATRVAHGTVNSSILSAAKLFQDFEKQRLNQLTLGAEVLGHDPGFVPYIQAALSPQPAPGAAPGSPPPPRDYASIIDQLVQRRDLLGSSLMMLLDDQGKLVARTDQPNIAGGVVEDLYEMTPLVRHIVDDATIPATRGVLLLDGRLYHASVAPLFQGANVRIGYILNAYDIDTRFASRIQDSTKASVMFVPNPAGGTPSIVRSDDAPQFGMQQMNDVGLRSIFSTGKPIQPKDVEVENSKYVMTSEPLNADSQTVGAAVFVRSLDSQLAPFRQIRDALLIGGGVALLLAFILSWLIAKRVTHPIEELAGVAQAVTAGDYTIHPKIDRSDEVGILGRSFEKMITALRDKSEIEELYEQMAARSSEVKPVRAAAEAPKLEEATVLVTDLRGLPATVGEGDAASVIGTVSRVMAMQEAEVVRQDGYVRDLVGNRLVCVFPDQKGIIHAIRAARAINEELAATESKMGIGVGIATGELVSGSIDFGGDRGLAIVGNAPLLAALFAWHAPPGHAYISYETAQAAGGEILGSSAREEVHLKWLPNPLPVAALPLTSLSTSMMRAVGTSTSAMATMRLDGTEPGPTAPGMPQQDLAAGALFAGRYRIESVLGRGGMGIVYKAVDTQLDEVVAIKTLPGDVLQRSPEDLERFKREIRLARKITHRNVLRTYDYGEAEGVYFISMEFVRGYTLAELLDEAEDRRLAPRVAMGIARQICRGLEAAHEQGIIHRDIKPQNVLIDHKGEVKLMDFGIARMAEAESGMTQAGLIVGTPHYMSPEQVQGKLLDPRSDVYSMGVLLYEMVTGVRPFVSSSLTGVLTAHITENPRPPVELRPEIGRDINGIILKCLAKNPAERYATSGELLVDLDRVKTSAIAA